jgi:hypothetical protein
MCPNEVHENGLLLLFIVISYFTVTFYSSNTDSVVYNGVELNLSTMFITVFYVFLPGPVSVVYGTSAVT